MEAVPNELIRLAPPVSYDPVSQKQLLWAKLLRSYYIMSKWLILLVEAVVRQSIATVLHNYVCKPVCDTIGPRLHT